MYNILHGFYAKQNKKNIYWLIDHQLNDNNLITIPVIEEMILAAAVVISYISIHYSNTWHYSLHY